jgi:hypothetical protein
VWWADDPRSARAYRELNEAKGVVRKAEALEGMKRLREEAPSAQYMEWRRVGGLREAEWLRRASD